MINFDEYEKIVIGIGDEFSAELEGKDAVADYQYLSGLTEHKSIECYNHLAKVLERRDYFIVSTCTDDLIYKSGLDRDRIVCPCGGYRYLQCEDDCDHALLQFEEQYLEAGNWPVCPHCKKKAVFNKLPVNKYNEGGYMDEWEKYNKWLQSTVNKPLLILELGVGMKYPSVIRFAFEKLAMFNKKSRMYRVHPTLAFATPEIKENCTCESSDSMEFLLSL